MNIPELIDRLKQSTASKREIVEACAHPNESVRGTALQMLADRFQTDPDVVEILRAAALDPQNARRTMGTVTLGHLSVKLLTGIATPPAEEAAKDLIKRWPAEDRKDLEWFLRHG